MNSVETIIESAVRLSVPLLLAGCGEYVAERAGTFNISLEGMMLAGAYTAVLGSSITGSPALGLLFGLAGGLLVAAAQANASHRLAANAFVIGVTLNLLVLGLTSFLDESFVLDPGRVGTFSIPLLSGIPIIGNAVFGGRWTLLAVYVVIPATWILVHRTRWGLEVRSVGEDPDAADASGVHVNVRRRQAIYWAGCLAGLGGAALSLGEVGGFNDNITAGQGFVVLAAVIFGGWTLRGTLTGCVLFGLADSLRLALPAIGYSITPQLLIAMPYLVALTAMVIFVRRQRRPGALGVQFVHGRR